MSRKEKFWVIFIIGVGVAYAIGYFSDLWLEYMCTLGIYSLIAAVIGASVKEKAKRAGSVTALLGVLFGVVGGLIANNIVVGITNVIAAIVWGLINMVDVPKGKG